MLKSELIEIIQNAYSLHDVCSKLYGYSNGRTIKKLKKLIEDNDIDITHFETRNKNRKYELVKKICPICKKYFETNERSNKVTCSVGCSNTFFRGQKTQEVKEKISESLKAFHKSKIKGKNKNLKNLFRNCTFCNIEFERKRIKNGILSPSKTCSKECSKKSKSIKLKNSTKERIDNGLHKGWQSRNIESYPEAFFRKVLENNKIPYEFNKPVKKRDLEIQAAGNYFLDFYLPECNIDLEIDGKQHSYVERVEKDKLRDEAISNYYIIYRIVWKSINSENGKKYIEQEINKFINFYNEQKIKTKRI